jgi:hypothetical protein
MLSPTHLFWHSTCSHAAEFLWLNSWTGAMSHAKKGLQEAN